ncbi:hypothetical protein [Paremcibacter congregatus]|uniref:Uncharacterized protein n=1 Tax=Paremcibacter congregatus TaxID=2043170 RepID=A0A2G4YUG5_9PROT|nr:hypothetical protein [Paremcibacter congregatus]PHZ85933.1 hypothetical protein CRD36_04460 [Paremcibacter congregatus]QDE26898.1 hypothetical protein FIV45_06230 [Paremcibacter congregatus]
MILSYIINFVEYRILANLIKLETFLCRYYTYGWGNDDLMGYWADMPADDPNNLPRFELRKGVVAYSPGLDHHYLTFRHKSFFLWFAFIRPMAAGRATS